MSYIVEVKSTFVTEDGEDGVTVTCPAQYRFSPERRVIRYEEYTDDGQCMHTRVVSTAEGVDIVREGGRMLSLTLREGRSFSHMYDVQYGSVKLEYTALSISDGLSGNGGVLTVRYHISIGGVDSENTVVMTVRETDGQ